MSTYYVTSVKKESAGNGSSSHRHIVGVYTANVFYSNREVAESIGAGHNWYTSVYGEPYAEIEVVGYCPAANCYHKPYLRTVGDRSKKNNLEELPER